MLPLHENAFFVLVFGDEYSSAIDRVTNGKPKQTTDSDFRRIEEDRICKRFEAEILSKIRYSYSTSN